MIATAEARQTTKTWQWHSHNFRAMNTNVYTRLFSQTDNTALPDVERLFASFENRLSRFKPDSELSRLNSASDDVFNASPTLFGAVELAVQAAELTGGLYDPAILANLEAAGYDRSFEQIDPLQPLSPVSSGFAGARSLSPYSSRNVYLNPARYQIHKPAGLKLDLGGMGKGWTVDRAADRLQGLGPFLINAGGDIFACQSPPGQKGWQIDLIHPLKADDFMARLQLHHKALATSTIAKRRWQQNGRQMHHIIDPRTGQPAKTNALSVTVVAQRTVLAEIYAKVALILGADRGLNYLKKLPGVEGLIFSSSGKITFTEGMTNLLDWVDPEGYIGR